MNEVKSNLSLGVFTWLAMIGDTHNRLTAAVFLENLRTALQMGRVEVWERDGGPQALMVWRQPTVPQWRQLLEAAEHQGEEAQHFENQIWLDFWMRPFGCDANLAQAVGQRFQERGIMAPKLNWHDPSTLGGKGALYLERTPAEIEGI